jgi:KDO2-lipid IV(A) lauroyltransferase
MVSHAARKKIKNDFIYYLILAVIQIVRKIPRRLIIPLMGSLGILCYYIIGKHRRKTIRQLSSIFGKDWSEAKVKSTARAVFRNLGRNAADVIRFKTLDNDRFFRDHVKCRGWKYFEAAHRKGKGVVCLSCHIGAFELQHHFMAWKGYPVCVIGTPLYDPRLNRLLIDSRSGNNISYVERGKDSGRAIIRYLRQGNLFGVLIDQDTKVEGVFAPFLGQEAYTPSTPVKLSMKTGAPIVPFAIRMDHTCNHTITIGREIELVDTHHPDQDLVENVSRCNQVISNWIRETPEQWVWMHRRWKTKKPAHK